MSKRCELQKEYFKAYGNYKGDGKYSDHYVRWLEEKVLDYKEGKTYEDDVSVSEKNEI
jgi:hypothetical protein|tara:strand:+ start:1051 stop:1224 length:174 start_codon:yes stop_codon:yes gene_type:complete